MGTTGMADRRDLAGDLRDALGPDEEVVWRSDAARAGAWLWVRLLMPVLPVACLLFAFWLVSTILGPEDRYWLLAPLLAAAFLALSGVSKSRFVALVLTDRHLLWRAAKPDSPLDRIDRGDIAALTVYEGDSTLVLHGEGGRRIKLPHVAAGREFATAIGAPALFWKRNEGVADKGWLSVVILALATNAVSALLNVGMDAVVDLKMPRLGFIAIVLFALAVALHVLAHWIRARKMDEDERRRTACQLLDPRWRGCDPDAIANLSLWKVPLVSCDLWLVRRIYGMPSECETGHEPEFV
ncbi:MAG: hypothetical protein HKM95_16970, partial [Inquilinus sp.]|nr:hypothetical protein [Inquilinus sp.]